MQTRIIALILACLSFSTVVRALEGVLIDHDGRPVVGARIQVLGRPGSSVTDAAGHFTLTPDPTVPFEVVVSRPDGIALRPIPVESVPVSGPIELRISPVFTDAVTVVSSAPADLELPPAAAFTLVGRADLEQRGPQHLSDTLDTIAGASGLERGHDAVPAIRGLTSGRTLILLDDGRVTAERRAGPSATFLDPFSIDEVEVVRGPGSVAYGSDAFGGVIRARTRIPGPSDPFAVRYTSVGATGTGERAVDLEIGAPVFGGGLLAAASYRKFEDYSSPRGTVFNSAAEFQGLRLGYQRAALGGNLRLLWRTDLGRDIGKAATDSRITRASYPQENSHRFALHLDRPGPGQWSRVGVTVTWDSYQLLTDRDRLPTATTPRQLTSADVDATDYGLRLEAERSIGAVRAIVGIDANGRLGLSAVNTTTNYGLSGLTTGSTREVSVRSARRDDVAIFVAASGSVGRVGLSAGVRGDRVRTTNRAGYFGDRGSSNAALSGFVAVGVPLATGLELSLQAARGFRDALLSDRYYRGISGRGFITGNPDLNAETSRQFDGALRWASGPYRAALYGYQYRIHDLIERYRTGNNYFFRNRGEAQLEGVELEGTVEVGGDTLLQIGLQAEQGKVLDDGTPTDGVPSRGGFLVVRRETGGRWWWLGRLAAYVRDRRPGPTEQVVPGYATLDAGLGYRLTEAFQLQLYGRNLLNRSYLASADVASVLAPGRSVILSARGVI